MVSRLVTPEAVLVELPTAGAASRGLARLIDLLIGFLGVSLVTAVGAVTLEALGISVIGPVAVGSFAVFAFLVAVPIGTELIWRGRSVGKAIMGLQVVAIDGGRVTARQVMVRGMVALLDVYMSMGVLALVSSVFSDDGRRLGDMAAGTVVVRRRRAPTVTVPVAFHPPQGFEGYVRQLPVRRLAPRDLALVRDYLLRSRRLREPARHELAMDLANRVGDVIGVHRPPHVDPHTWLVCVVSADQFGPGGLLADAALGLAPLAPVPTAPPRW